MSNNPLMKKNTLDSVKRVLSDNKVIVLFVVTKMKIIITQQFYIGRQHDFLQFKAT